MEEYEYDYAYAEAAQRELEKEAHFDQKRHEAEIESLEPETWRRASVLPKENKDVIAVLSDGTFFMARHSSISGWGFYFLDNGLQFDDSIGRKVTHWLPLTALPSIPA